MNRRPTQDPGPHTSTHSQGARPGPRHLGHFAGTYLASWAQIPVETQVLKKYFNVYENLGISALAPQVTLQPDLLSGSATALDAQALCPTRGQGREPGPHPASRALHNRPEDAQGAGGGVGLLPGAPPGLRLLWLQELAWRVLLGAGGTCDLPLWKSLDLALQTTGPPALFRLLGQAHRAPGARPLTAVWLEAEPGLGAGQSRLHVRLHTQPLHPAHVSLHGHAAGDAPSKVLREPAHLPISQPLTVEPS